MRHKRDKPAWWMLYALVPAMGGLLAVECRAALSPAGHKGVQIGIVLFMYGLVWVWLWANDAALLHDHRGGGRDEEWEATEADGSATHGALGSGSTPSQSPISGVWAPCPRRRTNGRAARKMRKCSLSLGRSWRRWRA